MDAMVVDHLENEHDLEDRLVRSEQQRAKLEAEVKHLRGLMGMEPGEEQVTAALMRRISDGEKDRESLQREEEQLEESARNMQERMRTMERELEEQTKELKLIKDKNFAMEARIKREALKLGELQRRKSELEIAKEIEWENAFNKMVRHKDYSSSPPHLLVPILTRPESCPGVQVRTPSSGGIKHLGSSPELGPTLTRAIPNRWGGDTQSMPNLSFEDHWLMSPEHTAPSHTPPTAPAPPVLFRRALSVPVHKFAHSSLENLPVQEEGYESPAPGTKPSAIHDPPPTVLPFGPTFAGGMDLEVCIAPRSSPTEYG